MLIHTGSSELNYILGGQLFDVPRNNVLDGDVVGLRDIYTHTFSNKNHAVIFKEVSKDWPDEDLLVADFRVTFYEKVFDQHFSLFTVINGLTKVKTLREWEGKNVTERTNIDISMSFRVNGVCNTLSSSFHTDTRGNEILSEFLSSMDGMRSNDYFRFDRDLCGSSTHFGNTLWYTISNLKFDLSEKMG